MSAEDGIRHSQRRWLIAKDDSGRVLYLGVHPGDRDDLEAVKLAQLIMFGQERVKALSWEEVRVLSFTEETLGS